MHEKEKNNINNPTERRGVPGPGGGRAGRAEPGAVRGAEPRRGGPGAPAPPRPLLAAARAQLPPT